MTYTFDEPRLGVLQIAQLDVGYTTANGTALAIPTPPTVLGSVVRAFDPTYGEGEFICLKGVASTAIGALVTYNPTTYQTALCPSTANLGQPVAVAMSACLAVNYGWYQIGGTAVVLKPTNKYMNALGPVGISSSVGKVVGQFSAGNGKEVMGSYLAVTAATAATTCVVVIDRPHMQGRTT